MTSAAAIALESAVQSRSRSSLPSLRRYVDGLSLQAVVIGHSKDPNAKLTILLICPRSAAAVLVVKAPTTDLAARAIEAEMRMLLELHRLCPSSLAETVPQVVDIVDFDGRIAMVTTATCGTPMTTSYMQWRHTSRPALVAADFSAAGAWLARLQAATAGDPAPVDMGVAIASRLRRRFAGDPQLEADLERIAVLQARLRSNSVPRTVVHGDFWIGNILLLGATTSGVVDWEMGTMVGDPLRDLVRFALMYALYLDRRTRTGQRVAGHPGLRAGAWGTGAEYALSGRGWFPDLFRSFLRDGLRRLGASPDSWRDAALVGLAEVAALTDDPSFGRRHLELFRRLSRGSAIREAAA